MKKLLLYFILLLFINISSSESRSIMYGDFSNLNLDYVEIPIVATYNDEGIVGSVRIAIKEGYGNIIFDEKTIIDTTTMQSVVTAVDFAESYTGVSDYYVSYDINSESVAGGSTGASIALALLSKNELITGVIDINGNLLQTGGIPIKVIAAAEHGYKRMYIPPNQSITYLYVDQGGYSVGRKINLTKYVKDKYNMDLFELQNIKDLNKSFI